MSEQTEADPLRQQARLELETRAAELREAVTIMGQAARQAGVSTEELLALLASLQEGMPA